MPLPISMLPTSTISITPTTTATTSKQQPTANAITVRAATTITIQPMATVIYFEEAQVGSHSYFATTTLISFQSVSPHLLCICADDHHHGLPPHTRIIHYLLLLRSLTRLHLGPYDHGADVF